MAESADTAGQRIPQGRKMQFGPAAAARGTGWDLQSGDPDAVAQSALVVETMVPQKTQLG